MYVSVKNEKPFKWHAKYIQVGQMRTAQTFWFYDSSATYTSYTLHVLHHVKHLSESPFRGAVCHVGLPHGNAAAGPRGAAPGDVERQCLAAVPEGDGFNATLGVRSVRPVGVEVLPVEDGTNMRVVSCDVCQASCWVWRRPCRKNPPKGHSVAGCSNTCPSTHPSIHPGCYMYMLI